MWEAFKFGFMYAAGAIAAALIAVVLIGIFDWLLEQGRCLVSLIRLARHKGESRLKTKEV
jgi:hypothetical protein